VIEALFNYKKRLPADWKALLYLYIYLYLYFLLLEAEKTV